ncbi:MAG TPA: hypothetical protein VLU46_07970, partial [Thermoanaerobaculia bacterium]|nr:hypothetical protein [Thermoanaerobaculia bacterium]
STNASPHFAGSSILFSSDVTGVPNIYRWNGTAIERLTNVYGGAFFPSTPDGRTVYYSDYSSTGFDLASFESGRTFSIVPRTLPAAVPSPVMTGTVAESTPYSPWQSAMPRWWFPIIGATTTSDNKTEAAIGATTSGGDVLGFHQYAISAAVTNRAGNRTDLDYAIAYAYDRLYPTLSLTAESFFDGDDVRNRRLVAQATFPLLQLQWQTYGWAGLVHDSVAGDALNGVRAGALFNNAHTYGFSISPENGVTTEVDYEHFSRMRRASADVRGFLLIPYSRSPLGRHVVAARVALANVSGEVIPQREVRVGGTGAGEFVTFPSRDLPVRGYDTGTLRGRSAAIASAEYRLPIYEVDRGPATYPIFFNRIFGDVFGDAGRTSHRTIASVGAELSFDITLGFFVPLRYRVGAAYLLRDPGKGDVRAFATIGSAF